MQRCRELRKQPASDCRVSCAVVRGSNRDARLPRNTDDLFFRKTRPLDRSSPLEDGFHLILEEASGAQVSFNA